MHIAGGNLQLCLVIHPWHKLFAKSLMSDGETVERARRHFEELP